MPSTLTTVGRLRIVPRRCRANIWRLQLLYQMAPGVFLFDPAGQEGLSGDNSGDGIGLPSWKFRIDTDLLDGRKLYMKHSTVYFQAISETLIHVFYLHRRKLIRG
ncbi:unnamed protein product [Miscanthus lutarioriparius]|uniref:Uncharacterized protein n=1 Tax=Miscanthus lutarioriparius TaxID=422564 RepID=A0A811RKL9_9POAL|nr:unnamed protein product [Miscanthus lutarioriparius]